DADAAWQALTPAPKAGRPPTMPTTARGTTTTIRDILAGDAWLGAGPSHTAPYLEPHPDRAAAGGAAAACPHIRQFPVPTRPVLEGPADDLPSGEWITATRDNILRFSVVAYFLAKQLHEEYGIPIGIINASVGGTPIESWTSEEG